MTQPAYPPAAAAPPGYPPPAAAPPGYPPPAAAPPGYPPPAAAPPGYPPPAAAPPGYPPPAAAPPGYPPPAAAPPGYPPAAAAPPGYPPAAAAPPGYPPAAMPGQAGYAPAPDNSAAAPAFGPTAAELSNYGKMFAAADDKSSRITDIQSVEGSHVLEVTEHKAHKAQNPGKPDFFIMEFKVHASTSLTPGFPAKYFEYTAGRDDQATGAKIRDIGAVIRKVWGKETKEAYLADATARGLTGDQGSQEFGAHCAGVLQGDKSMIGRFVKVSCWHSGKTYVSKSKDPQLTGKTCYSIDNAWSVFNPAEALPEYVGPAKSNIVEVAPEAPAAYPPAAPAPAVYPPAAPAPAPVGPPAAPAPAPVGPPAAYPPAGGGYG